MNADNPQITRLLRFFTAFEAVLLLIVGVGLFLMASTFASWWPWFLTPFNARFLGAVYLASSAAAGILAWFGRWSPARVVVPMIFSFTIIVLGVSLVYMERFTNNALSTAAWFALYIAIPLNALYHLWLYRELAPVPGEERSPLLLNVLRIQGIILGLYGVLLLVVPTSFVRFWPWPVDDFHARMYSVIFITPAVGTWFLLRSSTKLELSALGVTQIAGGALPIASVFLVGSAAQNVNWGAVETWLWVALFAGIALSGWFLVVRSGVSLTEEQQ